MILTAIEEYYTSSTHKPFFAVVSNEDYLETKIKLEEQGTDFIRLSDCCRGEDKKPDLDLFREKLRTADVDCKSNRVVVLGLAEYLILQGEEMAKTILDDFKDFNLGSAWVVFLLRGLNNPVKKMSVDDPRFDNRRFYMDESVMHLELELSISPTNVAMFDTNGLKNLLLVLEDGKNGSIEFNSDLSFPDAMCRIREIKDSYEAIRRIISGFNIPRSYGEERRWDYLLSQVTEHGSLKAVFEFYQFNDTTSSSFYSRIAGVSDKCWLYYLYLKLSMTSEKNEYLKYVLGCSTDFEDFKKRIVNQIIEIPHTDKHFKDYYVGRKKLLAGYPKAEIAQFVVSNRIDLQESIYKLTDNTTVEKQEIIALLSQFGRPDNLSDIYPDLCMYLEKYCFHGDTLSKELTEYFEDYKQQKIRNSIDDSFMKKVERYAVSREYNRLRTRDELISAVDRESTFLCWIDALGVEYLAYIVEAAKCRGLMVSVKVGRSKLPTITSVNNQFFYDWPEEHREKIEELDDVKHKEKGGYKYGPNNRYPIHLAKELEIIADAIDRAATELALRHYDKYVITSDHGASRLAVISGIEEKYETDTKGEHSGRCCKTFNNYDLPFATEESGFIVLADYGRFKGSRAANVEVHGGATLEEVVVPVIELSLSDNSIKIELADANVVSDYRNGADLCIFVNKSLTQKLCVHVDGEASQAVRTDENHYKVHVTNMKRAKTYAVDVYVGENLVARLDVTTKGKSASVNSEFDDLF